MAGRDDMTVTNADAASGAGAASVPALEARGLEASWDGTPVVADVSLALEPGEVSCLVGRSGCGKTTLFHALAGLTRPTAGQVLLHGREVTGVPGSVSYMLQKDLLLPNRTILDNVCLPLLLSGMPKRAARDKAKPLLSRFGLEECADRWPSELSGGMRQRAALLRTYLMDNDVVLLDEPFSALDAITRGEVRSWFCGMAVELGLTALVITHDVDESVMMSDRIFVMRGNPQAHVPSMICGVVEVERTCSAAEAQDAGFDLTPQFISAKAAVKELLGS